MCKIDDEYGIVKNMPKESGRKQQQPSTDASNPYGQWQGKLCYIENVHALLLILK
jgi:hypothetical protein